MLLLPWVCSLVLNTLLRVADKPICDWAFVKRASHWTVCDTLLVCHLYLQLCVHVWIIFFLKKIMFYLASVVDGISKTMVNSCEDFKYVLSFNTELSCEQFEGNSNHNLFFFCMVLILVVTQKKQMFSYFHSIRM